MKKKILVILSAIGILAGGTQAYADVVLNTNIVSLIQNGIASLQSYYSKQATADTNNLSNTNNAQVSQFVQQQASKIDSDLNSYEASQISSANQTLSSYNAQLQQAFHSVADPAEANAEAQLQSQVNASVQSIEQQMLQTMQNELQNSFTKGNGGVGNGNGNGNANH